MSLAVGTWVKIDGEVGYVDKTERQGQLIKVIFLNGKERKFASYGVEVLEEEMWIEDILELQHMAVLTNDKEWFHSLGELLQMQKS